eukprot:SAG11_NODE_586_length_8341_cov_33.741204_3_plen_80_part_00
MSADVERLANIVVALTNDGLANAACEIGYVERHDGLCVNITEVPRASNLSCDLILWQKSDLCIFWFQRPSAMIRLPDLG